MLKYVKYVTMKLNFFFSDFILNKVYSQIAMKNSIFASFGNSIIASQFLNGWKMVKWKSVVVEKYPER